MYNLECRFDSRQSFYGKAKVDEYNLIENNNNVVVKELYSYGTLVAQITNNKNKIKYHYFGKYSQTTTRHQKEFFKQQGLNDKEIEELFKNGTLEKGL